MKSHFDYRHPFFCIQQNRKGFHRDIVGRREYPIGMVGERRLSKQGPFACV